MKESEVAQSCPTLCDPMDCSLPGFSVHGIFQTRTLEWVAISFFKRNYRKKVKLLSHVQLFETPWIVAYQAPLSMGFSRQEYWSGLLLPSPTNLPANAWDIRDADLIPIPEKGIATHSSILAGRIPWTEQPSGLQSMGSQRVGHDWVTNTLTCAWNLAKSLCLLTVYENLLDTGFFFSF